MTTLLSASVDSVESTDLSKSLSDLNVDDASITHTAYKSVAPYTAVFSSTSLYKSSFNPTIQRLFVPLVVE